MYPVLMTTTVSDDQLRLLAKVARMYHERGIRQAQIATDLRLSPSRVSRLLSQAVELGIVRTTVTLPSGVYTAVEEELESRYGLIDSVVVDTGGSSGDVVPALGAAAASYIGEALATGDKIGISSWSATLLATVDAMRPRGKTVIDVVTQLVGGIGDPRVQVDATRLLDRFATITGGRTVFLPTPGVVADPDVRSALLEDPTVITVQRIWEELTVAIVGIGSVEPSPLLKRSGNAIDPAEQAELQKLGAVGDVCFRFFDSQGQLIDSPFDRRIVGISPETLKQVPRRVGVAGGPNKVVAIHAAVAGGWVNTLVTDLDTARAMLEL
jgi:DNA-binding transcriptional regulator LsrR (DeoR family)